MYNYSLRSLGAGSAKYGLCEVCGGAATEIFRQAETRDYERRDGSTGQTSKDCRDLVGHKECLLANRRSEKVTGP